MKSTAIIYPLIWGILFLLLPACQGGGGFTPAPTPQATAPEPPPAPAPAYVMGPGMQHNFGMMQNNMGQMYGMMGQGPMSPEHYNQMMGMMGQMGGMMQGMGSPYYNQGMEQRHRQQLQEMGQRLNAIQRQRTAAARTSGLGADLFAENCAGCHPQGGNIINPDLPLKGSPQLADFNAFLSFIRYPHLPSGAPGAMPRFSAARLSDQQARELYQYLTSLWGK